MLKKVFRKNYAGLRNWLLQRLTALLMAVYSAGMVAWLVVQQPAGYQAWKAMFSSGWIRLATLLFCWSLLLHAWLGVCDILKDYMPSPSARMTLQRLLAATLLGYAVWSAAILWGM